MPITNVLDSALDLSVAPGYSRFGHRLRGLSWESAIAGDIEGRTALVTGASSGIGEAACEGLAKAGARVQMMIRDRKRGEQARRRILRRLGRPDDDDSLRLSICDLSESRSIRSFVSAFAARESDLAILVNNAGVLLKRRERTSEGVERTFATNVLGPFLLTELLLPLLRDGVAGRVVNVSSGGMYTARLNGPDPQLDRKTFDGAAFYAHTKRAEVVLNELWAEREGESGVLFASMHPGWVDTSGLRKSLPRFRSLTGPLLRDEHQGADTIIWLATVPPSELPTGCFWHDRLPRPTHRLPRTRESNEDRRLLWEECDPGGSDPPRSVRPPA